MQITPNSSVLQALSSSATNPTTSLRRAPAPAQTQAAREAARAVFAQLTTPGPGVPAPTTPTNTAPASPPAQPRRNLPRGSIINILV
ncbi:MAG TPA: hypothetical protein VMQ11_00095 [Alphaproteobacteria bacterium]|nr:hypothetical protein [Alphaproteobacteria bacterium]